MDSRCPDLDQVSFSVLSSKTGQASGACDPKTQLRGWLTISTAPAPLFCVLPLSSDLLSPRILTAVGAWSVGIGSLLWMSPGAQVLVPPMFCDLLCCVCRPELLQPAVSGAPSPGMGALCGGSEPRACAVCTPHGRHSHALFPGSPANVGVGLVLPGGGRYRCHVTPSPSCWPSALPVFGCLGRLQPFLARTWRYALYHCLEFSGSSTSSRDCLEMLRSQSLWF